MLLVAPRIVNSVSCVKRIQHEIHFSWQAQYLVRLEDDSCCSAHCQRKFRLRNFRVTKIYNCKESSKVTVQ